jgi:hypothetical protein
MRVYKFGYTPEAQEDGYGRMLRVIEAMPDELESLFGKLDVALVQSAQRIDSPKTSYAVFEKDAPGTLNKYDVHMYVTVRVKFAGVEAESMEAAVLKVDEADFHQLIDRTYEGERATGGRCAYIEWDESGCHNAYVDVVGDDNFVLSKEFEVVGPGLVKAV